MAFKVNLYHRLWELPYLGLLRRWDQFPDALNVAKNLLRFVANPLILLSIITLSTNKWTCSDQIAG